MLFLRACINSAFRAGWTVLTALSVFGLSVLGISKSVTDQPHVLVIVAVVLALFMLEGAYRVHVRLHENQNSIASTDHLNYFLRVAHEVGDSKDVHYRTSQKDQNIEMWTTHVDVKADNSVRPTPSDKAAGVAFGTPTVIAHPPEDNNSTDSEAT